MDSDKEKLRSPMSESEIVTALNSGREAAAEASRKLQLALEKNAAAPSPAQAVGGGPWFVEGPFSRDMRGAYSVNHRHSSKKAGFCLAHNREYAERIAAALNAATSRSAPEAGEPAAPREEQ
jgi:hypothetical protein